MTAKDYLIALKVIREIQRKQAYCSGQSKPYLADTLKEIEMYCPLDFSKSGGRDTGCSSVLYFCGCTGKSNQNADLTRRDIHVVSAGKI